MAGVTPRRTPGSRLTVERLEDRYTPAATLITTDQGGAAALPLDAEIVGTSGDGRYVIFQSRATNVIRFQVDRIPNSLDLFWQDTFTGERLMVSAEQKSKGLVAAGGVVPSIPGQTANSVISADGKFVAFLSTRNANAFTSLVIDSNNGTYFDNGDTSADLFYWSSDFVRAAYQIPDEEDPTKGSDFSPIVSAETGGITNFDGEFFGTAVGNTSLASNPAISADGKVVSFVTNRNASQVSGGAVVDSGDNTPDLFYFRLDELSITETGTNIELILPFPETSFIDPLTLTFTAFGKYASVLQVDPLGRYMSADGKNFAVVSNLNPNLLDQSLPPAPASSVEVYMLTVDSRGAPDPVPDQSTFPVITLMTSAAGLPGQSIGARAMNAIIPANRPQAVIFSASVPGGSRVLVPGYTNLNGGAEDLYYREVQGIDNTTTGLNLLGLPSAAVLLTASAGNPTAGQNGLLDLSPASFAVDDQANRIVFTSTATNLVTGVSDTNGVNDVFVRDLTLLRTSAVSVTQSGTATGNAASSNPRISNRNGAIIGFESLATNLTPTIDVNGVTDVFVRDTNTGRTAVASASANGARTGNGKSSGIFLAGTDSGGQVAFTSLATDLGLGFGTPAGVSQGYTVAYPLSLPNLSSVAAVAGGVSGQAGLVTFNPDGSIATGAPVAPFPGFTGAVRAASGDVNGDGVTDLIAAAGEGGGPRVTVFSGAGLPGLAPLLNFFAYEPTLRNGVFVGAGDVNSDGMADIITGAGPGGGPRVIVFDSNLLLNPVIGVENRLADFFAFSPDLRDGVRVALKNVNGNPSGGIVAGIGAGGPLTNTYALNSPAAPLTPQLLSSQYLFQEPVGFFGAWVG